MVRAVAAEFFFSDHVDADGGGEGEQEVETHFFGMFREGGETPGGFSTIVLAENGEI